MYNACRIMTLLILLSLSTLSSAALLKDPTEPANLTPEVKLAETEFNLQAIVVSEKHSYAVINDKIMKVGDKLNDKRIKSINSYSVTLSNEKEEVILVLFGRSIKEPAK